MEPLVLKLDKHELIKRFILKEFNDFPEYYHQINDINTQATTKKSDKFRSDSGRSKRRLTQKKSQRFFINVGRMDRINEGAIVRLICSNSGISSSMIGEIDLNRKFSFFEVRKSVADKIRDSLTDVKLDGRKVHIEESHRKERARS